MTPTVRLDAVSTHSRLKAAGVVGRVFIKETFVSTHSRLKAAGLSTGFKTHWSHGFNTQPPEGGWFK